MPLFKIRQSPYQWEEVVDIVRSNKLERFARSGPDSEKYLKFKKQVVSDPQMSVFKYLLINQLQWAQSETARQLDDSQIVIKPKSTMLFVEPSDVKILKNDFPYNFAEGIHHLCVWTKFKIPVDPLSPIGDISADTRTVIERYLKKTFCEKYGIKWENLLWFKNWESLQSVKAMSHIHVIIQGVDEATVKSMLYTSGVCLTKEESSMEATVVC
ncbi:hypothetical protein PSN45_003969 [Yamadazyma tenuis]|uniref:Uncharacterized protein n=1 Tax=Candida tenuis (strain ATCC 10573 / BCRC 21748 / CBS 615 / JCM 9827 / NBRC 10315 / NRRL Y-1498 / VKM Y-70) TaxID=590646 RepID=G3B4D0_CANTC|nr:uncharacterized protein CANTEDRAFT_104616 [Yamadazyma tenuis ATCC 10573]EGV63954.1 hypothetical protein CANTEDRAFT_104616 [Yamadazyma tenuis ATCC 10573]WEJ96430.1 hypothetical protein PSN45_003969 [Yamadazyma tenuis]